MLKHRKIWLYRSLGGLKLKIASPLSKVHEVSLLAKEGASEFYCGIAPKSWLDKYSLVESITRRNNPLAHLNSLKELEKVVNLSKKYGIDVYVTFNEAYHQEQMDIIWQEIKEVARFPIAGIILGDPAALVDIRKRGYEGKIVIGTGGVVLNSEAVLFYKKYGVTRVILPRHLTLEEIKSITKISDMEYEAFVFRGLCPFIDGYCRFQHGINEVLGRYPKVDLGCTYPFRIKTFGQVSLEKSKRLKSLMSPRQSFTGCGLCALYHFVGMEGITLKIVGREFSTKEKVESLRVVKQLVDFLENHPSVKENEFYDMCKVEFLKFFGRKCQKKDCYYPELQY